MGLFDKKYCDICGEKIGLLGNRKLEDGNLCKDCAKSFRRGSATAAVPRWRTSKGSLPTARKNREKAAQFRTARSYGED